jgi:hypothetical protein
MFEKTLPRARCLALIPTTLCGSLHAQNATIPDQSLAVGDRIRTRQRGRATLRLSPISTRCASGTSPR